MSSEGSGYGRAGRVAPSQGGRERRSEASRIRMQNSAARLRQRKGRDEEHAVSQHGEDRDGVAERGRGRQRADQEREQRADAAAEIVAKALAGSAQPRRIQLGEERADAGEIAR